MDHAVLYDAQGKAIPPTTPLVQASTVDLSNVAKGGQADGQSTTAFSIVQDAYSNAIGADDEEVAICERAGAIPPVHSFELLARIVESSTAMKPVIDAISTNCEGHGHTLVSAYGNTLQASDIEDVLLYEKFVRGQGCLSSPTLPTKEDIARRRAEIEFGSRAEKLRLQGFLSACCPGPTNSLPRVRKLIRQDLLALGNGYMEIIRAMDRSVCEFVHLRATPMRLRRVVPIPVDVPVMRRLGPLILEKSTRTAYFRTFVQLSANGRDVYFKEYGDPRAISANDGRLYECPEEIIAKGHRPATEVIWFNTPGHSSRTVYGVPPWLGADAVLLGLRQAQVVNADHFSEKAIPQMVILVNGTRADTAMVNTIREHFSSVRGLESYHRVLVISAVPMVGSTVSPSIELKPLRQAIPDDALFQKYEQNCAETIRSQYRIAKLLIGRGEDVNRATSEAVLRFSEEQIFGPLRTEFDNTINTILLDEGYVYWRFKSNSAVSSNPRDMADIYKILADSGVLSENQLLQLASEIMNKNYEPFDAEYASKPIFINKLLAQLKINPELYERHDNEPTRPEVEPDHSTAPTPPEEIQELAARVRNHPHAEQGVPVDTKHGRTLVMLLPPDKLQKIFRSAA